MKIICAGWGRTGTRSIKYALERLSGKPSYHMQNILLNKKDARIWHNSIFKHNEKFDWEKIFDNSETKIGKFTPGKSLIPIENTKYFESYYSEYCILFAWNHEKEILKKEKKYKKKDGKWIIPIPKLKVI